MVLAVEPMVNAGRHMVRMGDDGWAIYSQDGSLAAHFEFTIAITAAGPRILTPWHHPEAQPAARPEPRAGPVASERTQREDAPVSAFSGRRTRRPVARRLAGARRGERSGPSGRLERRAERRVLLGRTQARPRAAPGRRARIQAGWSR